VIGSGPGLAPDVLMQAMRAGVNEYLLAPVTATDLSEAISRAWKRHSFVEHEIHGHETDNRGKVFAFLPVKGGTGTTTAAVNLAVALQRATGEKTLLVDLDMELGGVALLLGLRPRFSFLDLARNFHRLDPNLVSSYVESHPSGLDVLAAPLRPERSDVIAAEESGKIIDFLRQTYRYVILDMSKSLSPMMLSVMETADKIIAVTTADLPTLGSLKRLLPVLQRLDDNSMDRIRVVVNRYHPDGQVTIDDIRTLLDMDVHWTLSNDYRSAIKAANEGRPITLNGRSPYSRDIESIIGGLVDLPGAPATNGDSGLAAPLKRLFGLRK
jgi:pilus assembly protein CpaE